MPDDSCDVITVAQALHWFDLDSFYTEAKRILKRGGVLAVWAYNYLRVSPDIDAVLRSFHDEIVGLSGPRSASLSDTAIAICRFLLRRSQCRNYGLRQDGILRICLVTCALGRRHNVTQAEKGRDPLALIENELVALWGNSESERPGVWPLVVRLGRAS